jgi:hypothetical protein
MHPSCGIYSEETETGFPYILTLFRHRPEAIAQCVPEKGFKGRIGVNIFFKRAGGQIGDRENKRRPFFLAVYTGEEKTVSVVIYVLNGGMIGLGEAEDVYFFSFQTVKDNIRIGLIRFHLRTELINGIKISSVKPLPDHRYAFGEGNVSVDGQGQIGVIMLQEGGGVFFFRRNRGKDKSFFVRKPDMIRLGVGCGGEFDPQRRVKLLSENASGKRPSPKNHRQEKDFPVPFTVCSDNFHTIFTSNTEQKRDKGVVYCREKTSSIRKPALDLFFYIGECIKKNFIFAFFIVY